MSRTLSLTLASCVASEHDVVVLPTPPLPPQKIHFNDFCNISHFYGKKGRRRKTWSRMFWRVGARGSSMRRCFCCGGVVCVEDDS